MLPKDAIVLERDGKIMVVGTELQATVFERSGYKRVSQAPHIEYPTSGIADMNTSPPSTSTTEAGQETALTPDAESDRPIKRRRRTTKKAE